MAKTWTLAELVAQMREDIGRPSESQISDANLKIFINDYYINHFPHDAKVDEFDTFFIQALSATDDGVYDIAQSVDRLDDPVTINGNQIMFFRDREEFFSENHLHGHHHRFFGTLQTLHNTQFHKFEDEQFITSPTLVIGSSDSKKVKHSDFSYRIDELSYSKSSSEVDLTGPAVPSGKFGAWSLRIDEDGNITVTASLDNVTGYLTPRLALEALTSSDSDSAYMGYVTVIKSDGAFTPASTALDASNVTDTFTDGRFESRTTPISALLYGQKLYVHPKPNDIYQFKALQIAARPNELSDGESVDDPKWGPMVAIGAANIFLASKGETESVNDLAGLTGYLIGSIREDKIKRLLGTVVQRRF